MSFLEGARMTGGYGGADILHGCTIGVEKGEIAVIVGPNGAGKSTAMKAIFGMLALREGAITLDGRDIGGLSPQERVMAGMGFVPQTNNVFRALTVEENLEMGAHIRTDDHRETMAQVYALFPRLKERETQLAGTLSGGEQQMLALGRGLMARPRLLLLDEPTLGLAPAIAKQIFRIVPQLRDLGLSVLLAEQDVRRTLRIAAHGYVLENGQVAAEGEGRALASDPAVRRAYLGHD